LISSRKTYGENEIQEDSQFVYLTSDFESKDFRYFFNAVASWIPVKGVKSQRTASAASFSSCKRLKDVETSELIESVVLIEK